MLDQIAFISIVAATGIGAYTDWKTGYIYDWVTYPLIGIGILLSILTGKWEGIAMGTGVMGIGYLIYRTGKMGGGDVKLLAGISTVQPFFMGMIFPFAVLFIAALSASIAFSLYYVGRYIRMKPKIDWNTPQRKKAGMMLAGTGILLYLLWAQGNYSISGLGFMSIALVMGIIFYAFEEEIKKNIFLERITINQLEEDEVVAGEMLTEEEKKKWGKKIPALVGVNDIPQLKQMGFSTIPVYRNLPKFAPFLFLGVLITYFFPEWTLNIVPSFL
ncbi:MAG: A24 family peptidase [Candidatus Diapherotrites archaeon]